MNETSEALKRNWSSDENDDNDNDNDNDYRNDPHKRIRLGPAGAETDDDKEKEKEKEKEEEKQKDNDNEHKEGGTQDTKHFNTTSLEGPVVVEEGDELEDPNRSKTILNAVSRGHLIPTIGPAQGDSSSNHNNNKRWRSHVMAEDYISLVGNMMYPPLQPMAPFGYDPCTGQYPLECITTLSLLTSPLRRPTVIEKWSPYEIAVFEASLALVGKKFHQVQKFVKTKNCKEIIEFYYIWKKTGHYKEWKKQFVDPEQEAAEDSDDDDDDDDDNHS